MIICVHGKQMVPAGERGTYFICQLEEAYLGNHCRYVRWCQKENHYEARAGKNGTMCKFFSTKMPEVKKEISRPAKKSVAQTTSKEKPDNKTDVSFEEDLKSKDFNKILERENKE